MTTRAQINQGERGEDAAVPAYASNVLRSLVTAVTQAMTTTTANETVPVLVTPKTITYSLAINPYNKESFEMKTKEGKY